MPTRPEGLIGLRRKRRRLVVAIAQVGEWPEAMMPNGKDELRDAQRKAFGLIRAA